MAVRRFFARPIVLYFRFDDPQEGSSIALDLAVNLPSLSRSEGPIDEQNAPPKVREYHHDFST